MAKQEQLDLLQQSIETWNIWREQQKETAIDLREVNLLQANLRDANLRDANFSNAQLLFADFRQADLSGANFIGTLLRYANFSDVDLSNTNLSHTDLIEAKLIGTDLSGADLSGADLSGALVGWTVFGDLDLHATKGLETIHHKGPSTIGTDTLARSFGEIPETFLRGAGLDDLFISSVQTLAKKTMKYDTCFISYAHQDQKFAEQLYTSLQKEGVRCWFISEEANNDYKTWDIFDIMLYHHSKLVLVLSENSLAHGWIKHEVERALQKEIQEKSMMLYPIRLDKTILISGEPWVIEMNKNRHVDDFEEWKNRIRYEENMRHLLYKLRLEKK